MARFLARASFALASFLFGLATVPHAPPAGAQEPTMGGTKSFGEAGKKVVAKAEQVAAYDKVRKAYRAYQESLAKNEDE